MAVERGLQRDCIEEVLAELLTEAAQLFEQFKQNPQDPDTYWTLVRHYQDRVNVQGLDALRLYLIEHQPGGKLWPGNIDPRILASIMVRELEREHS